MADKILGSSGLAYLWSQLKTMLAACVKSVNDTLPDNSGNVEISKVPLADNLDSEMSQTSTGEFVIRSTGGDASISDGDAWALRILGNRVHDGYVAESIQMTVSPMDGSDIAATIDNDTFREYVATSGTITLTYTSGWSASPALYGITVSGTPVAGDQIIVVYVAEERGTITQATPTALVSTGMNLYDNSVGYAYVSKYSDTYGFLIAGTYTALKYSATLTGAQQTITPVDGQFTVPGDGYVWVTGGNATDTMIVPTWSDLTTAPAFETYSETTVNLATVMSSYFPYGLMRVGNVRDEIDLDSKIAYSRIGRMDYSDVNLASAQDSGRDYEYDEDYIYIVKETATTSAISGVTNSYTVSDHGMEFFEGADVAVGLEAMYGNNLKNKLERNVLTISAQELTDAQQEQVQENIGVKPAATSTTMSYKTGTGGTVGINTVQRVGKVVSFCGRIHSMTTNNTAMGTYFTLPAGYRPPSTVYVNGYAYVNSTYRPAIFMVTSSGAVSLSLSSSLTATDIYIAGSFGIL